MQSPLGTVIRNAGAGGRKICLFLENSPNSTPKLGFIWKKIGKKLISTDYGRYGSQYSPKKSKKG